MVSQELIFGAIAVVGCAIAAVWDWRTGLIPNTLSYGLALCGLVGHFVYGWIAGGFERAGIDLAFALGGAVAASIVPFSLYRINNAAVGGGDIKLLAAVGALLGPVSGVEAEFYGFFIAILYYPAKLAYQGTLIRSLKNSLLLFTNVFRRKGTQVPVPDELLHQFRFAPALAGGTVIAVAVSLAY